MDGLGTLILILFLITFAPPVIFLVMAAVKWKRDPGKAKIFLILGTLWLIIGGGSCLSIMT